MSNIEAPKISVIMPVLNKAATVEKAITSLLAQRYPNLEFIVMDGGSGDGTIALLKKYHTFISYWCSQPDGNRTIAMNKGLAHASGEFITFLMADDWYEAGLFSLVAATARAHPDVEVISCGGRLVYYNSKQKNYDSQWTYCNAEEMQLTFTNICFGVSALSCRFIRKSLLDRVGHFQPYDDDNHYIHCNEKELLLRIALQHPREFFIPMIGHNYLARPFSHTFGIHPRNLMSLCRDQVKIARMMLKRKELTQGKRLVLHYWYTDQLTRLVLYSLAAKNPRSLVSAAAEGMRKYHFFWPFAFVLNTVKIVFRRLNTIFNYYATTPFGKGRRV